MEVKVVNSKEQEATLTKMAIYTGQSKEMFDNILLYFSFEYMRGNKNILIPHLGYLEIEKKEINGKPQFGIKLTPTSSLIDELTAIENEEATVSEKILQKYADEELLKALTDYKDAIVKKKVSA